jgi:hypothetical protein
MLFIKTQYERIRGSSNIVFSSKTRQWISIIYQILIQMNRQTVFFSLVLISCLFLSGRSFAQSDQSSMALSPVGVGLHAEQYKIGDAIVSEYSIITYASTVLIPINCSQHFRIEPEIGMLWMHSKEEEESNVGVSIGTGAFAMFQREKINLYTGGRIIFNRSNMGGYYNYAGIEVDLKLTIIQVGPAFGFEYFLCPDFSIGGETGLQYSFSKMKAPIPNADDIESTNHAIHFDSGIFVRVYF